MDDQTKLFIDISKNLGEINTKLGTMCDAIAKHESRIQKLENNQVNRQLSLKDEAISWLIKGLISSILIIASLTGASGLILKIFGQ